MNMMARHVDHGKLFQYANDTVPLCSGVDCQDVHWQISEDLQLLFSWIDSSKMKLNVQIYKSSVMWFLPRSFSHLCLLLIMLIYRGSLCRSTWVS